MGLTSVKTQHWKARRALDPRSSLSKVSSVAKVRLVLTSGRDSASNYMREDSRGGQPLSSTCAHKGEHTQHSNVMHMQTHTDTYKYRCISVHTQRAHVHVCACMCKHIYRHTHTHSMMIRKQMPSFSLPAWEAPPLTSPPDPFSIYRSLSFFLVFHFCILFCCSLHFVNCNLRYFDSIITGLPRADMLCFMNM